MQVTKLKTDGLEVGALYIAYSARSKMLSSNGPCGVFVKVLDVNAQGVSVDIIGTGKTMVLKNLDTRQDAWMYSPFDVEMEVNVKPVNGQWPQLSERMVKEGWNNKKIPFISTELYENKNDAVGDLTYLLRHRDENQVINNIRLNWVSPSLPPEWRIPRAQRMGIGAVEIKLPPKPVAEQHKGVIEGFAKQLDKLCKGHKSGCVSYMMVDNEGKEAWHLNEACHYDLKRENNYGKRKYVLSTGHLVDPMVTADAHYLWIVYLTSYSPYADAFITKDPEFIIKWGYVMDCNVPKRILAGALMATRQVWEHPERAMGFLEIYKQGINIDAAFIFGGWCNAYCEAGMKLSLGTTGHSHDEPNSMSDQCIANFIHHSPQQAGKLYCDDIYYSEGDGVNGMWSTSYGTACSIREKLKGIIRKGTSAWDKKALVPVIECAERAADIIDEWLVKKGI